MRAVRKAFCKRKLLVCENGSFCGQREKACANEGLLYIKGQFLRTFFKLSVNRKLLVCEKGKLFQPTQSHPIKEKLFSTHKIPTSHCTKLTCSCKFHPRKPTVSLQYNNPFSKTSVLRQLYSHPFAPIQILTDDTRELCVFLCRRLHDDGRSFQRKSRIERRFESLPGVQRVATLWGTPRSFRTREKNKLVLFPENIEVLQTSIQLAAMAALH